MAQQLTEKDRHALRCAIADYCIKPRKMKDVKAEFKISGISAGAYLSALRLHGVLSYDRVSKLFKRNKGCQVSK